ncbi:MAG: TIGR00288 family NYN domain-containing protein [Theionarchaea archaeon]|nr:TIGR00288 family NYN domain-containing protein [Theionarchaea archaeon]
MTPRWRNIKRVSEGITRYVGSVARKKRKKDRKIGLLIDGPNILRKEFGINLDDLKAILEEMGDIRIGKVLLNQYASQGLIEAIANQGFDSIVVAGDTDVRMGIEAKEIIYNDTIDTIALASRDADFLPILVKSKEYGKETIVIGAEPGFSIALQNAADVVIMMGSERPADSKEEEDIEV